MKKQVAFLLPALVLTVCSCTEKQSDYKGKEVNFTAVASDADLTRSVYGDYSGSSQPLYWLTTDRFTVYCAESFGKTVAEYKINELQPGSYDTDNYASIVSDPEDEGLKWGEDESTFYAVSPSVSVTGGTINGAVITGTIPASQDGTISGDADKVVTPDMDNMYLVAKTTTSYSEDKNPFLDFKPMTTAIEFTVKNGLDEEITISSMSLISAAKALSGGFTINMDQEGVNGRHKTTLDAATQSSIASHKKVTISLGTGGVTLAAGKSVTLTFFLNPGNTANDLSLEIVEILSDSSSKTYTAKLKNDEGYVEFATHKKTIVAGIVYGPGILLDFDTKIIAAHWITDDYDISLTD